LAENNSEEDELNIFTATDAKPFRGIEVQMWTEKNIQNLIKNCSKTLLCGIGFICNVCIDPEDFPDSKKRQNKNKMEDWVSSKKALGFDSMQSTKTNLDNLIFWKPFAVLTTKRVKMNSEELIHIYDHLKELCIPGKLFKQELIHFEHPCLSPTKVSSEKKDVFVVGLDIKLQVFWDEKCIVQDLSELQDILSSKLKFCSKTNRFNLFFLLKHFYLLIFKNEKIFLLFSLFTSIFL